MTTQVGSGASSQRETGVAVQEAVEAARAQLAGAMPLFGFLFAGPDHDLQSALHSARTLVPGLDLVGSSSAGELTERGLIHGGVAVMLVASDAMTHRLAIASGVKATHRDVADRLCAEVGDVRKLAQRLSHKHLTTVLLADGLAGTGEDLVHELLTRIPAGSQVVGGAAGDEARFQATHVAAGEVAAPDAAAALHVFSRTRWGIGVNHGLRSTTNPKRVTRAKGNVVFELDGAPAFEAYRQHAVERGVSLVAASAGAYLIGNELGIHFFDKITRVRAPLSVGADGSLSCAAAIPEGAMVSILDGEPTSMIEAARGAAQEALEHLEGGKAAGVLLFDCVCRGMILKDSFQREIDAVRSVFGDVPVAGFLTYGEIARYSGRLEGWHNATAVVAAIPA